MDEPLYKFYKEEELDEQEEGAVNLGQDSEEDLPTYEELKKTVSQMKLRSA